MIGFIWFKKAFALEMYKKSLKEGPFNHTEGWEALLFNKKPTWYFNIDISEYPIPCALLESRPAKVPAEANTPSQG